ncbi:hypothetical protein FOZ60_009596 [Perkinsus olseni]|uniref:Uncharacterized protein n=1 Tax=Perkinsus olseni TaxID=32597 RepID=A0A7J6NGT3_PEROL|nr:hypothetical protein FOZ60_009596 [Perkinsus olseni]
MVLTLNLRWCSMSVELSVTQSLAREAQLYRRVPEVLNENLSAQCRPSGPQRSEHLRFADCQGVGGLAVSNPVRRRISRVEALQWPGRLPTPHQRTLLT